MHHGEEGVLLQVALIAAILKGGEEHLGRVVGCAVKSELLTRHDAWVTDCPVVYSKLVPVVHAQQLPEYLGYAVNRRWLEDHVCWGCL